MSSHLPNLTVQQLEYLVAAADAPTRAAAASGLGVTPSALTQGLAELERRVGLPLFERWGRHTELRPQAAAVLAHARRVVAETGDLARWARAQRTGSSGLVRLGAIDAVAVHHRADAIRAYRHGRPDVDLHLTVAPSGALLDGLTAGDLDVVVVHNEGRPAVLENTRGNRRSWVGFRLHGAASNPDALGARLTLEAGGSKQMETIRGSTSYSAFQDLRVHFGLGDADQVDRLHIRWPDGTEQVLENLPARQYHALRQD